MTDDTDFSRDNAARPWDARDDAGYEHQEHPADDRIVPVDLDEVRSIGRGFAYVSDGSRGGDRLAELLKLVSPLVDDLQETRAERARLADLAAAARLTLAAHRDRIDPDAWLDLASDLEDDVLSVNEASEEYGLVAYAEKRARRRDDDPDAPPPSQLGRTTNPEVMLQLAYRALERHAPEGASTRRWIDQQLIAARVELRGQQ